MTGIVLQTHAVDIVNKGGGYPTKTFRKQLVLSDGLKTTRTVKDRMESTQKVKGTDYVVFVCPAPDCGSRNKKSVYEAKAQTKDGRLSFKCHKCYREVEVQRPIANITSPEPISNPEGFRPGTLLGPNGLPIGR